MPPEVKKERRSSVETGLSLTQHVTPANTSTLTFIGNILSLPVKILIPVAVCIFVAIIVIVCWKYCKHEHDEARLVEIMSMVSV